MREKCIQEFMDKAKKYIEMPKLTPELLQVFIHRIEVGVREAEKYSRTYGSPVIIHYAFQLSERNRSSHTLHSEGCLKSGTRKA